MVSPSGLSFCASSPIDIGCGRRGWLHLVAGCVGRSEAEDLGQRFGRAVRQKIVCVFDENGSAVRFPLGSGWPDD